MNIDEETFKRMVKDIFTDGRPNQGSREDSFQMNAIEAIEARLKFYQDQVKRWTEGSFNPFPSITLDHQTRICELQWVLWALNGRRK